ncbi:hypothetical protein M3Y97_00557000 [Aphelenchoides bicaudatus]|nr:hypothetical protein M3Y97_00557000 [Aphelenchoides bicaudatus]
MEFMPRTLSLLWLFVVYFLLIVQPVKCRFYRNIPVARKPQRVVQVVDTSSSELIPTAEVEVFEDDETLMPRETEKGELGASGHLMLLRPDYTFRRVASIFRNLFDKRVSSSVSERRRRTELADAYLRRHLQNQLQKTLLQ